MREDFYEAYNSKILPAVIEFEPKRKLKLLQFIITKITLILFIIFIPQSVLHIDIKIFQYIMCLVFILSIGGLFSNLIKKDFENDVKKKIMPIICKCLGNIKWRTIELSNYPFRDLVEKSAVIYVNGIIDSDDVFTCEYKNVKFDILELKYTHLKSGIVNFSGIVLKIPLSKKFEGHTVINQFGAAPNACCANDWVNLKHIDLRNIGIDYQYNVYTNNENEARTMATLPFLEKLGNLKKIFHANRISCAFYQQNLLIAIHRNKDMFSICSLFKRMDDFKLNQKIGL